MFSSFTCSSEQQTQLQTQRTEAQQPSTGVNQKVTSKSQYLPVSYHAIYERVLKNSMIGFSNKPFWLTAWALTTPEERRKCKQARGDTAWNDAHGFWKFFSPLNYFCSVTLTLMSLHLGHLMLNDIFLFCSSLNSLLTVITPNYIILWLCLIVFTVYINKIRKLKHSNSHYKNLVKIKFACDQLGKI